ncbi:unnamed protein product [Adineta steineri]|uniref:Uncharacterized protein n=1 Tax=Adineta steineri TaxID=433720 RepID=A0A819QMU5_9BILA|nr:unnamed protein product [Adineta steineri]
MSTSLVQFYDPKKKRVVLIPTRLLSELKPKIVEIFIGKNSTKVKMAPKWFKHDDQNDSLKNIIYPENVSEKQQYTYNTVARYRAAANKPNNNFANKSLKTSEDNTETLIIALDNFVQQFGGQLSFTHETIPFNETAHRAACGVGNLSSAHLLATDYIPTAQFTFKTDLDYQTDLARSSETMQDFILDFSKSIANILDCPNDYVRVISVEKPSKIRRQTKINFGISTPDPAETEKYVEDLKIRAKKGFSNHRILKHVKADNYDCKWIPLINFFQLSPSDFVPEFNVDYRSTMPTEDRRADLPYYLPIGWYRHALKVLDKYPDDKLWIGSNNTDGEFAVAYHGTHAGAVQGIKEKGLLITNFDAMRSEAVIQKGEEFDKPGLYVATHCTGGSHPAYTQPFTIQSSQNKSETFRVVFQCRVKPNEYTVHTSPVTRGQAWRFVDPNAIRPYGILVKNEAVPDIGLEDEQ